MQGNSKEFVEYKSFDELPDELKKKFKSGARGLKLDEAKDAYIGFINQLKRHCDELIDDYVGALTKTQVKFGKCHHVADISPDVYKRGHGCGICDGKQVQRGINDLGTTHPHLAKEWHIAKNGGLTPHDVTRGSAKKVWWICDNGHEWTTRVSHRTGASSNCPYCSNQKVLKGYNDIATIKPEYVKYFTNIEEAYSNTHCSKNKVELKCPECKSVKTMIIHNLTRQGFSCDKCSDGVSFPEKLTDLILTKLNIEFIKQMSYDKGRHKYDFYLPKYNAILETHGLQHYGQGFKSLGGKTLEEEQENDKYKRELAIINGILYENYHEIDCRRSVLEYCRPGIENALGNYVDMSILADEDWKEADIQAQKSLKIEICKYWKENKEIDSSLTPQRVADVFGIGNSTVWRYLQWGGVNGFCTYETDGRGIEKLIYLIKPTGEKWFEEAVSMNKLAEVTNISLTTIARNLNKKALKYNNRSKYDPKYIGSRIVSAEVYDNQTQTNQNT